MSPNYSANAAIALSGSFALGIFAVWFVGFVGGSAPRREIAFNTAPVESWHGPVLPRYSDEEPRLVSDPDVIRLLPRAGFRELDDSEIDALLASSDGPVALACAALLSGMTPDELVSLNWDEVDFVQGEIRVGSHPPRQIALQGGLAILMAQRHEDAGSAATVLHDERGEPWTPDDLAHAITCAAYDAALVRPDEITPATLRHTWLAWLFRQGVRAADVTRLAGNIPHEEFVRYMQLAASSPRVGLAKIDPVHPVLRRLFAATHPAEPGN